MHSFLLEPVVRAALLEDLSHGHDLTTEAIVDAHERTTAHVVARKSGTIFGHDCARIAFTMLDPAAEYSALVAGGAHATAGARVATISARPALS